MNFQIVATYDSYINAHLAMGQLESENINCWLKDEYTVTIDPILTNAVGGIKLMVAEPQLERALQIIGDSKKNYQQQNPCPQCGSSNVEYISSPRKISNWLSTFVTVVLSVGAPLPVDKVYHCFDCDFEYQTEQS